MLIIGEAPDADRPLEIPVFPRGSTLAKIQKRGTLRIGAMLDLPDFLFRNPETGTITGFEADIARILAQSIFGTTFGGADRHIEYVEGDATTLHAWVRDRHVDIVLANFADTANRRKTIDFAGHFLTSSHAPFIDSSEPDIFLPSQLNGARVAVGEGSTDVDSLLAVAPNAELIACSTASECIEQVVIGEADAYWTTRVNGPGYIRASGGRLREAAFRFRGESERWAIAIAQNDPLLKAFIDDVMQRNLRAGAFNVWLLRCFSPLV